MGGSAYLGTVGAGGLGVDQHVRGSDLFLYLGFEVSHRAIALRLGTSCSTGRS